MAHSMIIGGTESGKTSLAKLFAKELMNKNRNVLVCDPLLDRSWCCDYITENPFELLEIAKQNQSCHIFLDESGDYLKVHDKELHWFATRSRHDGHSCYFIAQRAYMLAPTVRNQTTRLFMFNTSLDDSKLLANEYNAPSIITGNKLNKFEYFYCGRFTPTKKLKLSLDNLI